MSSVGWMELIEPEGLSGSTCAKAGSISIVLTATQNTFLSEHTARDSKE